MWDDVVRTALVGTQQRTPPRPQDGAADALIGRLEPGDAERLLLVSAAVLGCRRRAGRRPGADPEPAIGAAPGDDLPPCGERVAADFRRMVGDGFGELAQEWLSALVASGRRAPDEVLPDVLDMGRSSAQLRPLIRKAVGARGAWLAAQNPDWEYAAQTPPSAAPSADMPEALALWQTGTQHERLEALERCRAVEPDRARDALAQTWAQETAEDRAAFIKVLARGLNARDEDFLEQALDDRRKEVRREAAELLARMPSSRLCERMRSRGAAVLKITKRLLGAETLEVQLPETCDPATVRDGIEAKPPQGIGERGWWMKQIVARVPPGYWSERLGRPAAQILAANRSAEWSGVLLEAWTEAAIRFRDAGWAAAVLNAWTQREPADAALAQYDWASVFPQEQLALTALSLIRGGRAPALAASLLERCQATWSQRAAREWLGLVRERMRSPRSGDAVAGVALLHTILRLLPPEAAAEADEVARQCAPNDGYLTRQTGRFAEASRFRQEMIDRIREG